MAILITQCVSMANVNSAAKITEVMACPNTVKIESRVLVRQFDYARYQGNFFRLRKVMFANHKPLEVK